ncbi:MAG: hypothetical protein NTU62_14670 [Spirochaetes bacterium]|nr:hypothetical protein [Spirochaetota bacterium]
MAGADLPEALPLKPMMPAAGPVPPAAQGSIQVSSRSGLGLRAGDVVTLNVLKRLTDDKWAVGLKGRVVPARSDLDLVPGSTLRARVQSAAGRIVFVLDRGTASPLAEALGRQGIPSTPEMQLIAAALVRSGRAVDQTAMERVRTLLLKTRLEARRGGRAAATMLDKGIDLSSEGAADLLELLCLGDPGGRGGRRYRGRPFPRDGAEAKGALATAASPDEPSSGLQVYNALRGRSETWIVVPFLYRDGEVDCPGSLRLLVDPYTNRLCRLVVGVRPAGGEAWHFEFDLEGRRRMTVYCDDPAAARAARANLDMLSAKVHNMGIEASDTVRGGREFDGFSSARADAVIAVVDAEG